MNQPSKAQLVNRIMTLAAPAPREVLKGWSRDELVNTLTRLLKDQGRVEEADKVV